MASHWPQAVLASYVAGADLSAKQYTFVKLDTAGAVVAVAAVTDIPIGVLQNAPKAGETAEVVVVGGTKVVASASITLPALLVVTNTGTVAKAVPGTDTTKHIVGQADEAAGNSGEVISAIVNTASPARGA